MKRKPNASYHLLMTMLMCIFTFIKIIYLYLATISPSNSIMAYIRTLVLLVFLYILLNLMTFKKSIILKLGVHELFAVIILADIMYFRYFNTLPTVNDLQMLNLLLQVRSSISGLFQPLYFVLFSDLFVLIALHFAFRHKLLTPQSYKKPVLTATLLAIIMLLDLLAFKDANSHQIFNSFGVMQFHIKQTSEAMKKSNIKIQSASLIKSMKDVSKSNNTAGNYFGLTADKNIIVIQVEALQSFVINRYYNGQELTPNLNKLIKQESLYFDRYYQHIGKGGTSDAEFATQNSLYPSFDAPAYYKYASSDLYGLPHILKSKGYSTLAFHGFKPDFWNRSKMYPAMGFDKFISSKDLAQDDVVGLGISDQSFFKQTVQHLKNSEKPFYAFLVTLSSHYPYGIPDKYNKLQLNKKHQNTLLGRYIQTINYTDRALGEFISMLKQHGLYDDSIIAIYGDHHGISVGDPSNKKMMTELLGYKYDVEQMLNVPLIIHIPGSQVNKTYSVAGGQMDFLPTMLNLLGIKEGNIKFYGQDLCNAKDGFAASQHVMPRGSFIDNEKVYLAASDGIFEHGKAWDYKTKQPIELELCRAGFERAMAEIDECDYLLSNKLLAK